MDEGWRFTITWLNTIGAGLVVTGFAVPLVAWGYHASGYAFEPIGLETSAALTLGGLILHLVVRLLAWIFDRCPRSTLTF